jgi:hypothetical protein
MGANASRIATVDLIDEITATADPILAMTIGIDVIIAGITAAMKDATTTVVTTALITAIEVIVVMIVTTTGATIDVARMTTTTKTTTAMSGHLRHHPKGATPMVHSIPEGQSRDQLHRWWSPSDQNQPADSIERQGDRARQH